MTIQDGNFDFELDPDFRPKTYWDPTEIVLANINGDTRRANVLDAYRDGTLDRLPAFFFSERLTERETIEVFGFDRPSARGGEDLPEYLEGEVEIARITFHPARRMVVALRARKEVARIGADGGTGGTGDAITYRAVSDVGKSLSVNQKPTRQPLTQAQLVEAIKSLQFDHQPGPVLRSIWSNVAGQVGLAFAVESAKINSFQYPQVEGWYAGVALGWALTNLQRYRLLPNEPEDPAVDPYDSTALHLAVVRNDMAAVEQLIDRGANLDGRLLAEWEDIVSGPIPRFAVNNFVGHQLLEDVGLLPLRAAGGCTALQLAQRAGNVAMAGLLIEAGADPRLGDRGNSALVSQGKTAGPGP